MKLPAFTYGLTREVKARSSRLITQLKRGASWAEATDGPMLDTADTPGLIVLKGPSPLLGGKPHFHVYLPVMAVFDAMLPSRARLPESMEGPLFAAFLESAWGTLALQGPDNQLWVWNPDTWPSFLRATLRYWPEFDDEPRYTAGSASGTWLWKCLPAVRFVLVHLGVPKEALFPLLRTHEELLDLLARYQITPDSVPVTVPSFGP